MHLRKVLNMDLYLQQAFKAGSSERKSDSSNGRKKDKGTTKAGKMH